MAAIKPCWTNVIFIDVFIYYCAVCSVVPVSETPRIVAHQAPLSRESSRQEYWSGLPCPLQGIFPTKGSNLRLLHILHWQADSLPLCHLGSPLIYYYVSIKKKNLKWLLKKNWILAYFTQRHSTVLRISPLMPLPVLRYWPPKVLLPRSLSSDLFQFADDHPKIVVLRQNIRLQAHANMAEAALSSLPSRIPYFWAMNQDCLTLFDTITEEQ